MLSSGNFGVPSAQNSKKYQNNGESTRPEQQKCLSVYNGRTPNDTWYHFYRELVCVTGRESDFPRLRGISLDFPEPPQELL